MDESGATRHDPETPAGRRHPDPACERFRAALASGDSPHIDDYLKGIGEPARTVLRQRLRDLELAHLAAAETISAGGPPEARATVANADADAPTIDYAQGSTLPMPPGPVRNGPPAEGPADGVGFGDYRLLGVLGRGGMGVVYRARQVEAGRDVALKLIRPELLEGADDDRSGTAHERFLGEARAAARLVHDNIVTVFDVGEVEGRAFYSMRYVEGSSLAAVLLDKPLKNREAAALLAPVARAVHHAHTANILHRDVKPSNILIDREGRPYVTDFGLAKWLSSESGMTASGDRLGTPSYMSPEQARGTRQLGAPSDVSSLGATLYEALTGRPPFRAAEPVETLRQVIDDEPVPPHRLNTAIDRDLETVCLKCLQKDPRDRYPTAEALARDLERYLADRSSRGRSARWSGRSSGRGAGRRRRRR